MKRLYIFNVNGDYIEDKYVDDDYIIDPTYEYTIDINDSLGVFVPKLVDGKIVEALSPEEIQVIRLGERKVAANSKLAELGSKCRDRVYEGFQSLITREDEPLQFGFDAEDQLNFNGQTNRINLFKVQLALGELTREEYDAKFPIQWKTKNRGVVFLTESEFLSVVDEAETHLRQWKGHYWTLEYKVLNAMTVAEIHSIQWESESI